jgi:hypothetical protein
MAQVTIYVEDAALEAAKRAAEQSKVSLSQWFARFAIEEKTRQNQDCSEFFKTLDGFDAPTDSFPSLEEIRSNQVPDVPRENW